MNESHLRELIEEATIDCYDEHEEFWGLLTALGDELSFPFEAKILGDSVTVTGISQKSTERRGVLVEVDKKGTTYTFPLSEIGVSSLDESTKKWVAAYQLWSN